MVILSFLAVALSHLISIVQLLILPAGLVFCELFPELPFPELLLPESSSPDMAVPLLLSDSLPPEPELLSVAAILSVDSVAKLSSETAPLPAPSPVS